MLAVLRARPVLRRLILAHAQSQLGSGAAYVALLLLAYHRLHSGWGVSLVLLGDFLPGIALSAPFGMLADRFDRRRLAVAGDLIRAGAFLAIAIVPSLGAMIALALVAGVGSAVWRPAVNAALPSLVDADERSAATSAWSLCMNLGMTAGPALSALALLFVDPAVVLGINGLTFAVSAVLLAGVPLGRASGAAASAPTDARRAARVDRSAGVGAAVRVPGVMAMIGVSSGVVLAGAMMNVAEPVLTVGPLHGGASAFGLLAALYGIGMIAGSVWNSRAGSSIGALRGRWLGGIALTGVMLVGSGLAPALPVAAVTFALTGLGNSLVTGSEIRLLQEMSPTRLLGSVFGLYDALQNGAFVVAFAVGGALVTTSGARTVFLIAGIIALSAAALAIRRCRPITDIAAVLPGLEPVADGTPATA